MNKFVANISYYHCKNCGWCSMNCPVDAIYRVEGKYTVDTSICVGCGECVKCCSVSAISMQKVEETEK